MVRTKNALASTAPTEHQADTNTGLGRTVRDIRRAQGVPLQAIADRAGLSVGLISQIERGLTSPSIRSLRLLAAALEVPVERFFTRPEAPDAFERDYIMRPRTRQILELGHTGITIEIISPHRNAALQTFIANLRPGACSGPEMDTHDGEEAGLVLAGRFELWLKDKHFSLSEGDSFQFSSRTPHRYVNPGTMIARVQWVVTPPIY